MTISIGTRLVHRAKLYMPWGCARWVLKCWFPDVPPTGKVTVQWGNTQIIGTVVAEKSGQVVGESVVTIVGAIGWQNAPPATWLVDNSAQPSRVVQQLAQAVGETIAVDSAALVTGRSAFARANQLASITLESLLVDEAIWWTNLDGTTEAALDRPSPALSPATVLHFDAEARTAILDIEEPANIVGATIAASGERVPIASRIYELEITADEKGIRAFARLEKPTRKAPFLSSLLEDLTRSPKPYPHATFRGATVESQDAQRRVSLRLDDREKELSDPLPVPVWTGVPGTSAEVFSGTRIMLAFDRANPAAPFAALWSPYNNAGHVPKKVFHDAHEELRFVGSSAGVAKFGTTTVPVAKSPPVVSFFNAVKTFATAAKLSTDPTLAAAALALETALNLISGFPTTKLEAE